MNWSLAKVTHANTMKGKLYKPSPTQHIASASPFPLRPISHHRCRCNSISFGNIRPKRKAYEKQLHKRRSNKHRDTHPRLYTSSIITTSEKCHRASYPGGDVAAAGSNTMNTGNGFADNATTGNVMIAGILVSGTEGVKPTTVGGYQN